MPRSPRLSSKTFLRVETLCRFGARIPMLESLFPMVKRQILVEYLQEISGNAPTKGPSPSDWEWFLRLTKRHVVASVLAKKYLALQQLNVHTIDALIATIALYQEHSSEWSKSQGDHMNAERIWLLIRGINAGYFELVECRHCGNWYLHSRNKPVNHKDGCPVHRYFNLLAPKVVEARPEGARPTTVVASTCLDDGPRTRTNWVRIQSTLLFNLGPHIEDD